ncbi:MAG: hypothetical protein ACC707_08960, partial [Thiohalomonadales bacterium]
MKRRISIIFVSTSLSISTLAACTHFPLMVQPVVQPTTQALNQPVVQPINRPIKFDLECSTHAILDNYSVKKVSFIFLQNNLSHHSDENKSANNLFIYGYFKLRLENSYAHIYVPTPI